ncbi:FRG domain protein [compost metagenome]
MTTLSELVERLKTDFPQQLIPLKQTDLDRQKQFTVDQPRYLFRGERNAGWMSTKSTFSRFGEKQLDFTEVNYWITGVIPKIGEYYPDHYRSLYPFLKSALTESEAAVSLPNIEFTIAAILQHYGFDTSFIDVTSSIDVAAAFASTGKSGEIGKIMVLETSKIEDLYFDLAAIPGNRPSAQHAFVLWGTTALDLKSEDFIRDYSAQWFEFELTDQDKKKFANENLLALSHDKVAVHILDWYASHIENNLEISNKTAVYFANIMEQLKTNR